MANNRMKDGIIGRILGFSLGSWISAVISFLATLVITRKIAPESLGEIDLFVTYYSLFIYAATMGMHQGYMRFYNEPPQSFSQDGLFAYAIRITAIFCCIISIPILAANTYFAGKITDEYSPALSLCICACFVSQAFLDVAKTKPRMENHAIGYSIIVVLSSICVKLGYLIAAYASNKVKTAITMITILNLVVAIAVCIRYRKSISIKEKHSHDDKTEILKYSIPFVPVMFLSNLNASIPKLIMNLFCEKEFIGIYSSATTLVGIIGLVQTGVNVFWGPYVYKNYKEKPDQIAKVQSIITVFMIIAGLLLILSEDLIFLLLGANYRIGKPIFGLLLTSPILYTIGETLGIGINISKKSVMNNWTMLLAGVSNVLSSFILIPKLGISGAALSVMIASIVVLIAKWIVGCKYYRFNNDKYKAEISLAIYIAATVTCFIFDTISAIRIAISLLAVLVVCWTYNVEIKGIWKHIIRT